MHDAAALTQPAVKLHERRGERRRAHIGQRFEARLGEILHGVRPRLLGARGLKGQRALVVVLSADDRLLAVWAQQRAAQSERLVAEFPAELFVARIHLLRHFELGARGAQEG